MQATRKTQTPLLPGSMVSDETPLCWQCLLEKGKQKGFPLLLLPSSLCHTNRVLHIIFTKCFLSSFQRAAFLRLLREQSAFMASVRVRGNSSPQTQHSRVDGGKQGFLGSWRRGWSISKGHCLPPLESQWGLFDVVGAG